MATLIITEKASQAKDLHVAFGERFGQILPAEGHLLRLAEPEEVNAAWKSWSLPRPRARWALSDLPGHRRKQAHETQRHRNCAQAPLEQLISTNL
jgi:DNA topoisomerase IA